MPSRPLSPPLIRHPSHLHPIFKTKAFFLVITLSSFAIIFFFLFFFLLHLYHRIIDRSRTIPLNSSNPFKLQRFSYKELKSATNSFSPSNALGKGGSGTVFRGILRDGKSVAVKKLDVASYQAEREFQNELQVLDGLRSPHVVSLLGYCIEKNARILVYEYMSSRSLQESLFAEASSGKNVLSWEQRFTIIQDVADSLEFLHNVCDPPVIHGDVKPSNILLDSEFRAKISDFGLSRFKSEGEFGVEMYSTELWKSQELSGNLGAAGNETPGVRTPVESSDEVDFALALQLQASCSSKSSRSCCNDEKKSGNEKGKEVSLVNHMSASTIANDISDSKLWGEDWWWRQHGSDELCNKDYVMEWIESQICPPINPDWDGEEKTNPEDLSLDHSSQQLNKLQNGDLQQVHKPRFGTFWKKKSRPNKKHRKMLEWWREDEVSKLKKLKTKWKKSFKIDLGLKLKFHIRRRKLGRNHGIHREKNVGFSFSKGKKMHSAGSEMWSGDLFSRELSSTTSLRGTLCYVAPEYGGCGDLMEKGDIYSLGVLILVVVSGRRPLHVLSSPMKLEKANLVSWSRHLAQRGNILDLVDERLRDGYSKEQASLCVNLALICLQKMPELRPDIGEIVKILRGEVDLPAVPFEFSPSPPSKLFSRSRRRQNSNPE